MRALAVWILALLVPFAVAQCPSSRDSVTDGELLEDPMGHAFEVYFDSKV